MKSELNFERGKKWNATTHPSVSVSKAWGCSSVGRAPALQAGGQRFEPAHLHQSCESGK